MAAFSILLNVYQYCVLQDLRQSALSQTVDIEELERGVHSSISAVKVGECYYLTCTTVSGVFVIPATD